VVYTSTMSEDCAPQVRRFHNGVSCLSMGLMRDILKDYKSKSPPAVAAMIRPYAKAHKTKAALFQHMLEVIHSSDLTPSEPLRTRMRSALKPILIVEDGDWLACESVTDFLLAQQERFKTFKTLGWYDSGHLDRMLRILKKERRHGIKPTRFGGIVNLNGSHYTVVFFDVKARTAEYFDSFGKGPPARVRAFLDEAVAHLEKKHRVSFRRLIPTIRHQNGGRECGMYACWFVLQRLQGKSYAWTQRESVPDESMAELRPVYFRT
jgi:hypothetical protein